MSNPDSFIDEVTEEVRRDKLFAVMRKYGWIAVTLVLLLVGGAAYNEWSKARAQAAAEALGDAILQAEEAEDVAARNQALAQIAAEGDAKAILGLLQADLPEDSAAAAQRLAEVAGDATLPKIYRDLAVLKQAMLTADTLSVDEAAGLLEPLLVAGAPFRVLAEEQMALVELANGEKDAAISRLNGLLQDEEATRALRQRASQLIVSLGGTLDAPAAEG